MARNTPYTEYPLGVERDEDGNITKLISSRGDYVGARQLEPMTYAQAAALVAAGGVLDYSTVVVTDRGGVKYTVINGRLLSDATRFTTPAYVDQATAFSGAPTITSTGAAAPGSYSYTDNNTSAFTHYGPGDWVIQADTMFVRSNPNSNMSFSTFGTDATDFYFTLQHINTNVQLFCDEYDGLGWKYCGTVTVDASGAREYVHVVFSTRKPRAFKLCGFNYAIGSLLTPTGGEDLIFAVTLSRPIMHISGDSYTGGTGAAGAGVTWAQAFANALGYELISDGLSGSGWNTASPNSPAERVSARGQGRLKVRTLGVDAALTPDVAIYALGYNDAGGSTTAAQASIASTYAACAVKPIFIGPWTPLGDTTNLTAMATAIEAQATSLGAKFISAQGIVSASNNANLTGGDNVHPTQYGHNYIGYVLARRARSAMIL